MNTAMCCAAWGERVHSGAPCQEFFGGTLPFLWSCWGACASGGSFTLYPPSLLLSSRPVTKQGGNPPRDLAEVWRPFIHTVLHLSGPLCPRESLPDTFGAGWWCLACVGLVRGLPWAVPRFRDMAPRCNGDSRGSISHHTKRCRKTRSSWFSKMKEYTKPMQKWSFICNSRPSSPNMIFTQSINSELTKQIPPQSFKTKWEGGKRLRGEEAQPCLGNKHHLLPWSS